jgi:aspartate/methionine/tyrosine aminotransferase
MESHVNPIIANQNILDMEYAVRGPIAARAAALAKQGKEIIPCNIGNPQALGQRPLTYFRQVLSLLEYPSLIEREQKLKLAVGMDPEGKTGQIELLSDDILNLSEEILAKTGVRLGAYTESKGFQFIREAIADFIDNRDQVQAEGGLVADPAKIFLTSGASEGVKYVLDILIAGPNDGIMIPIPQYPLYSAAIKKAGGVQINYYPDEEKGWLLDRKALIESYNNAVKNGVTPKAIVVINPGNPTGAILTKETMEDVVSFARDHNMMIIADEVYQENIYHGEFISFAKIVGDQPVALASLHSISKGFFGECGHRGGYLEIRNAPPIEGTNLDFVDVLTKLASVSLCSNTPGQILTYLMVCPPPPNSDAHRTYQEEKTGILRELYEKAVMVRDVFDEMTGMDCFGETGALYLFPRISGLPEGKSDFDYCMALLEETGICTVNGSGFGQRENTQHLRMAFLPPKDTLAKVLPAWINFHNRFLRS